MIDFRDEELMPLNRAARQLPRRRGDRPVHVATLYRWAKSGCRGVRLETLQVGGSLCTSRGALQRFFERLTAAGGGSADTAPVEAKARPLSRACDRKARRAAQLDASRELDRLGF